MVGDLKSPESEEWDSLQNVVYLDVDKQLALGYEILQHLPFHSYARKVSQVCNDR